MEKLVQYFSVVCELYKGNITTKVECDNTNQWTLYNIWDDFHGIWEKECENQKKSQVSIYDLTYEETQILMKYKDSVDQYFDTMIPQIYLSRLQQESVYYVDDNGNLVVQEIKEFLSFFLKCIKAILVALYTYITFNQNIHIIIENKSELIINLLKSFGVYDKLLKLPIPMLINLLYTVIRIYKYKGSYFSLEEFLVNVLKQHVQILESYAYVGYDINSKSNNLFFDFRTPSDNKLKLTKSEYEISTKHYYLNSNLYPRVIR